MRRGSARPEGIRDVYRPVTVPGSRDEQPGRRDNGISKPETKGWMGPAYGRKAGGVYPRCLFLPFIPAAAYKQSAEREIDPQI